MTYDNTNRWTLNRNERKEADTHPDYKGRINIDGVDYWLDGWIKEGQRGKFISGKAKIMEQRQTESDSQPSAGQARQFGNAPQPRQFGNAPARRDDLDDEMPF